MKEFKHWTTWQTKGFQYDWDGVAFEMEVFKEDVTLDELNEGATYDNDLLTIREELIPDYQQVRIAGLPTGSSVKIGREMYRIIMDRIFNL